MSSEPKPMEISCNSCPRGALKAVPVPSSARDVPKEAIEGEPKRQNKTDLTKEIAEMEPPRGGELSPRAKCKRNGSRDGEED
ncbi:uncharacterized protein RHO25_007309 [Cercospora beticola]|uniref:Uncharacterized protein n=1 Tax=Cercospora beticola TaxID=122368 RepID=A0ABZ0NSV8_CERBT|nr:hypothetical protein RHO25_007309 [Cercospora beticola]